MNEKSDYFVAGIKINKFNELIINEKKRFPSFWSSFSNAITSCLPYSRLFILYMEMFKTEIWPAQAINLVVVLSTMLVTMNYIIKPHIIWFIWWILPKINSNSQENYTHSQDNSARKHNKTARNSIRQVLLFSFCMVKPISYDFRQRSLQRNHVCSVFQNIVRNMNTTSYGWGENGSK